MIIAYANDHSGYPKGPSSPPGLAPMPASTTGARKKNFIDTILFSVQTKQTVRLTTPVALLFGNAD